MLRQEFAYQDKLLVETGRVAMGHDDEDVLSHLRRYGESQLWRCVSDDVIKYGKLNASSLLSSDNLPDLAYLFSSGAATDVTSLK